MREWVSAREALRLAKTKGVDQEDLLEWARLGRLGARARSAFFSDDDPSEERVFLDSPPIDETEQSTRGPWPDIPTDFWAQGPKKAAWAAGTFASRLRYWSDYHGAEDYVFIELRGVSFNSSELEALLEERSEPVGGEQLPRKRWQKKRVTPRQALAVKFIETITRNPPKDLTGKSDRYRKYCDWHEKQNLPQKGSALGRTSFNECASRYDDGWRVSEMRWVYNP